MSKRFARTLRIVLSCILLISLTACGEFREDLQIESAEESTTDNVSETVSQNNEPILYTDAEDLGFAFVSAYYSQDVDGIIDTLRAEDWEALKASHGEEIIRDAVAEQTAEFYQTLESWYDLSYTPRVEKYKCNPYNIAKLEDLRQHLPDIDNAADVYTRLMVYEKRDTYEGYVDKKFRFVAVKYNGYWFLSPVNFESIFLQD